MSKFSRRSNLFLGSVFSLTLALGACGGGGSGGKSGSADRTFIWAAAGVPSSLDIWQTFEGDASRYMGVEWGSTLVEYDPSKTGSNGCDRLTSSDGVRPHLAKSWTYDGNRLLFTLRDDAVSTHGNKLTAEDVVWSLQRAQELASNARFVLSSATAVKTKNAFTAIDDHTVAISLDRRTALDAVIFTFPQLAVIDSQEAKKHATAKDPWATEWLKTNVASFGPWKLKSFGPGSEVVYERNSAYWDQKALGDYDKLIFKSVPDPSTRFQLLKTGGADYAEKLSFDQYKSLKSERGSVQVQNCVSANRDTLMLNESFAPFANQDVRLAISKAIDRQKLTAGVYGGYATPADQGLGSFYFKSGTGSPSFAYDPGRAKQLLNASGNGNLSFKILVSPSRPGAYAESLAVQLKGMLADVGITANIDVVAGATQFSDAYYKGTYQAILYNEAPAIADPFYSAALYNSERGIKTFGYRNAAYEAAITSLQQTVDPTRREKVMGQVAKVVDETVPQVYLTDNRYIYAMQSSVSGFMNAPNGSPMVYRLKNGGRP
ncbi:ABC transporter substrate-binding protein [Actinomadura sp. 9N215]|uniref:ABC transporter substrate-binding protein n=1 Tax=Actinomadura sp. 9N215 TaxID=3375150 RepID=UPI0037C16957